MSGARRWSNFCPPCYLQVFNLDPLGREIQFEQKIFFSAGWLVAWPLRQNYSKGFRGLEWDESESFIMFSVYISDIFMQVDGCFGDIMTCFKPTAPSLCALSHLDQKRCGHDQRWPKTQRAWAPEKKHQNPWISKIPTKLTCFFKIKTTAQKSHISAAHSHAPSQHAALLRPLRGTRGTSLCFSGRAARSISSHGETTSSWCHVARSNKNAWNLKHPFLIWLFQLDDLESLYEKWLFYQTSISKNVRVEFHVFFLDRW